MQLHKKVSSALHVNHVKPILAYKSSLNANSESMLGRDYEYALETTTEMRMKGESPEYEFAEHDGSAKRGDMRGLMRGEESPVSMQTQNPC